MKNASLPKDYGQVRLELQACTGRIHLQRHHQGFAMLRRRFLRFSYIFLRFSHSCCTAGRCCVAASCCAAATAVVAMQPQLLHRIALNACVCRLHVPYPSPQVVRKALASAITLGSGASLGPEAPSVELGANTAAVIIPKRLSRRRQRMLLAAGAAAGVSAAFDAPVAGALFAVEFVLKSSRLGLDR